MGKKRLAWRYDPVLLTDKYTVEVHLETFDRMAEEIAPFVDRCIFSFVEMYDKVPFNMPEVLPISQQDRIRIAEGLGSIAKRYGLTIQTCASDTDYSVFGIQSSGCVTLDILGKANDIQFRDLKHKGMRRNCGCMESRDIGWYDTCLNGCKYCYANKNPQKAFENFKDHDPDSPLLLGHLKDTDVVQRGNQTSYLKKGQNIIRLDQF